MPQFKVLVPLDGVGTRIRFHYASRKWFRHHRVFNNSDSIFSIDQSHVFLALASIRTARDLNRTRFFG